MQHLRQCAVAESDCFEPHVAVDPRQLESGGTVDDLGLLVEDLDDLVERSGRREERVVELRELLDGIEEVREVEEEREQRAHRDLIVEKEVAAVAEHDRGREGGEEVDGREVEPVEDDRLVVRVAVEAVDAAEADLVPRLARVGLDDAHAGDVLRKRRGDEADALTHAPVGAVGADAEPDRRERHQRQHRQRREREPPVEHEQDDSRADEQHQVLHERGDAVGDQRVERLDVVRDAADDGAGAVALEVPEREPLQVREELDPQVGERTFAHPAGEVRLQRREPEGRDVRRRRRPPRSTRASAGRRS